MKIIKGLIATLLLITLGLWGLTYVTKDSTSEIAGVVDQINPLVKTQPLYVKTIEPQSVNDYGTASYTQTAYNQKGQARKIQFNGITTLKTNHYLKLTAKGGHVETYEEVQLSDIPLAARQQLN